MRILILSSKSSASSRKYRDKTDWPFRCFCATEMASLISLRSIVPSAPAIKMHTNIGAFNTNSISASSSVWNSGIILAGLGGNYLYERCLNIGYLETFLSIIFTCIFTSQPRLLMYEKDPVKLFVVEDDPAYT